MYKYQKPSLLRWFFFCIFFVFVYDCDMWREKRVEKGIYSLIKRIDEHILKIAEAKSANDFRLWQYYLREIQTNFIDEIEKKKKTIRVSKCLKSDILACYTRYDEIKGISWD